MATRLPTPRETLTSLITAISHIPVPSSSSLPPATTTNPLSLIPASARPLLTTLHVLFPTHLLPALDLLDRRLVTRVVLAPRPRPDTATTTGTGATAAAAAGGGDSGCFYLVRSAAAAATTTGTHGHHHRRKAKRHQDDSYSAAGDISSSTGAERTAAGAARSYVVRLPAWNCTCAAFAFSAFPVTATAAAAAAAARQARPPSAGVGGEGDGGGGADENRLERLDDGDGWEFGGMSLDGLRQGEGGGGGGAGAGGPVPCCKHLLACVLAERWDAALGRYVAERRVGREEMAGIEADV